MELTMLTDAVDNAALSLFNAIKYIYMISDEDFYNVNIKDMFRVTLNDVTNPDALESLGLRLVPDKIKELDKPRFDELLKKHGGQVADSSLTREDGFLRMEITAKLEPPISHEEALAFMKENTGVRRMSV